MHVLLVFILLQLVVSVLQEKDLSSGVKKGVSKKFFANLIILPLFHTISCFPMLQLFTTLQCLLPIWLTFKAV